MSRSARPEPTANHDRTGPVQRQRLPELDILKAVAIVAVVLIHAIPPFWVRDVTTVEKVIGHLTRFAVPAFLAVSGFLYYQPTPIDIGQVRRRLRRILPPYVCVSLLAFGYDTVFPGHAVTPTLAAGLVWGGTFGPYYYVVLLVQFVCVTWLLSRLPSMVPDLLLLPAAGTALWADVHLWVFADPFWTARNSCVWAVWFLLGWVAAARRDALFRVTARRRIAILAVVGGAVAIAIGTIVSGRVGIGVARTLALMTVPGCILWLFTVGRNLSQTPGWASLLSQWTYAIYLLHPFFIYMVGDIVEPTTGLPLARWWVLNWVVGLTGAVAATALLRQVLGSRSRTVIGA